MNLIEIEKKKLKIENEDINLSFDKIETENKNYLNKITKLENKVIKVNDELKTLISKKIRN